MDFSARAGCLEVRASVGPAVREAAALGEPERQVLVCLRESGGQVLFGAAASCVNSRLHLCIVPLVLRFNACVPSPRVLGRFADDHHSDG